MNVIKNNVAMRIFLFGSRCEVYEWYVSEILWRWLILILVGDFLDDKGCMGYELKNGKIYILGTNDEKFFSIYIEMDRSIVNIMKDGVTGLWWTTYDGYYINIDLHY